MQIDKVLAFGGGLPTGQRSGRLRLSPGRLPGLVHWGFKRQVVAKKVYDRILGNTNKLLPRELYFSRRVFAKKRQVLEPTRI